MRVLAITCLLLLGGCVESGDSPAASAIEPSGAPATTEPTVDSIGPTGNDTIGAITLQSSGQAGDWIVAYHAFPEPISELDIEASYSVTASGDVLALFVEPRPALAVDGGWRAPRFSPFEPEIFAHHPDGMQATRSYSGGASSSNGWAGIFFAFASNQAWNLDVTYRWAAGNMTTPASVQIGSDAIFTRGGDMVGLGSVAGQATLDATVPAGWTHVEALATIIQPDAVRSFDMSLANGHQVSGTSTMTGYYVPVAVGGSASSSGRVDYMGSLANEAGPVHAEITFVEASLNIELGYVHIPVGPLPGLVEPNYDGTTWPFDDII